jgi:hypothetical protein
MHSPALRPLLLTSDIKRQKAISALDALQNLMYLIRIDAADPARVRRYVEQAEMVLEEQESMLADILPVM